MTATRALRALVFCVGISALSAGAGAAQDEVPVDTTFITVEGEVLEGLTVEILSTQQFEYRSYGQRYDFIGPDLMDKYRTKYSTITDRLRVRFPGIRV